VGIT